MTPSRPPIFISGPTATGKSELAIDLAEKINGEIISVDSMQVYKGLDVGTAKPSLLERTRVRHHGINLVDLKQTYDAAQFVQMAEETEAAIQLKDKTPIFCGGTGFYYTSLLHGVSPVPPSDASLRNELEALPIKVLLEEIQIKDPTTWHRIDRMNKRRLVRAVEVIRLSGQPFSSFSKEGHMQPDYFGLEKRMFWIQRSDDDLRDRIRRRCEWMFENGLVKETVQQLDCRLRQNRVASNALGYRQVIAMLDNNLPIQETMEEVQLKTWQFARRQRTWQRNQLRFQPLILEAETSTDRALNEILSKLGDLA